VSLRLKSWNQFAEGRAVGPYPMNEYDAGFALRGHRNLPSLNWEQQLALSTGIDATDSQSLTNTLCDKDMPRKHG
jgi:hypothetical protein